MSIVVSPAPPQVVPSVDVSVTADTYDIEIEQGATFAREFTYTQGDGVTPMNLTGWTARSQIRKHPGGPLVAEFTAAVTALTGVVTLSLTATQTGAIYSGGVYDLELVNGVQVDRLIRGRVTVTAGVTTP